VSTICAYIAGASCALPVGSLEQAGRDRKKTIHFFDDRGKLCITLRGERPAPGVSAARNAAPTGIDRWIRRELARAPLKAKSLVVTVWGDSIAPHGGAVWLSGLIRLLAPLGLNERLVRTSVYRLTREGWLSAQQDGRRSFYRLTAAGSTRFERAYRRIYAPRAADWDETWDIVLAPAAALSASARRELRKELRWEGFGALAPGVFVRPAGGAAPDALADLLGGLGLQHRVSVLSARDAAGLGARSLQAYRRDCWNLAGIAAEYRRFQARFDAVLRHFRRGGGGDPERSFVVRSLLIHAFRRVTLHDPQLPPALLPPRWPAAGAYALCADFYRLTQRSAEQHLLATLSTPGGRLPPAAPYFYGRFGGLR
jgi:phenylacetic acid degradation operon negative regulatory protein